MGRYDSGIDAMTTILDKKE